LLSPACYAKFAVSYSFINWIYFEFLIVLCSRACTFLLRGQISVVSSFTDSHIGLAHPGKISFTLGWNILTWISFPLAPNANQKRGPKGGGGPHKQIYTGLVRIWSVPFCSDRIRILDQFVRSPIRLITCIFPKLENDSNVLMQFSYVHFNVCFFYLV
jgi:hypothetical protein